MKRIFILLGILFSLQVVFSQNIIKAEYFLDADPGQGKGTAIPGFASGEIVNFSFAISTSDLTSGFHFLNTRVADADGKWSRYETRIFFLSTSTTNTRNITGAEYFIDSDTIPGSGVPINIGTPGPLVNFTVPVPAGLNPGFHSLGIRVRDEEGKWSIFEERSFYVIADPVDAPPIVAAEYFYDVDPGIGNASPLIVSPTGSSITQTFLIPVPDSLSQGDHVLAIRVKDEQGHWSFLSKDTVTVNAVSGSITCPGNITVDPFTNNCKAIVNNIDAVGLAEDDSSYSYTLSGATTGNGIGTASGQLFNAGVTTVTYALINAPTVSCSFTVTVNTSVTPTATISIPVTTICEGTPATFVCTYTGGGFFTTSWQWKKNGINVGTNSNIYRDSTLQNDDAITVAMTSAIACAVPQTVTSSPVIMTVHETVTPSVSIIASTTTVCPGQLVTFTATPINGGSQPLYEWMKNGSFVGTGTVYQTSALANGDSVYFVLHNTTDCVTNSPVRSNAIYMTGSESVTPSVTVTASSTTVCNGQMVTFTAAPVHGGATPAYQWKLNGNNVGSDSPTYQNSSLVNGDVVSVVMTSSVACANPSTVPSNTIVIAATPSVAPMVTIQVSASTICPGTTVTFTATPTDGGTNPVYQWKLNGNNVGNNSPTYQTSSLQNGDKVKVVMTSSVLCAFPSSAVSEEVTMTVNDSAIPSVTIEANATAICVGQIVTFTALPENAGNNPVYEWTLNNNAVGSDSPTYQCATLADGDIVRVTMAPSQSCGNNTPVVSNAITMTVGAGVTPSVTMSGVNSAACEGTLAIFYASPISGAGSSPSYQWKRNGVNIPGATNATYQSSSLQNGDVIRVAMTSSLSCANPQTVLSHDSVTMIISSVPLIPSVTISASATAICQGQTVLFTAVPTNGGDVPGYQWKLNGINVGDNSDTFSTNSLQHGDIITVEMATSVPCSTSPTATSPPVTMTVTTVTTFYADFDGDGYGNGASGVAEACTAPAGYVSNNSDCNDGNASVRPGATEICGNGADDDCDGQVDETCVSPDSDGDGYTIAQGDCNDSNASINPGATEICDNSIDDNCNGNIDENCTEDLPVLVLKTYPVKEGDAGYTILNVEVKLDRPATANVSVNYGTTNANATAGLDYVAANGLLTIPAGAVSGIVQVRIIGDLLQENNESFWINFSNPVNVVMGKDPRGRIMIIDDDKGKGNTPTTRASQVPVNEEVFRIPSAAKRNQVWMIPQIENYENEVLIVNIQGQVVSKFINYKNQTTIGNVATGIYFYRIRLKVKNEQDKFFAGRLLITE
ncbi:MAG TPA: MopE-related protein [Chitinophagaceae bacterium]|nr:MopE-related protein [Chitinophagaceae bacterium]